MSKQVNINYYAYDKAVQILRSQQLEHEATKSLALAKIYQAIELPDLQAAHTLLLAFLQQYKDDQTIYLPVSEIAYELNDFTVLQKSVKKALMHDSFNAKCHYDFGTLLLHSAEPHNTLGDYLLTLNANTLHAAVSSQPFVKEGVFSSIERHFRSTAVKSRCWNDYVHLGNFLVFVRSLQKAAKAYKQATLSRKNCAVAYRNLSFVLGLLDRQKESHIARAHSNFIEENYAPAITYYEKARLLGGVSIRVYQNLAKSYLHERGFSEAVAVCAKSPRKTIKLYAIWIRALQAGNQIEQALQVADRACAVFPESTYLKFPARLILPVVYKTKYEIKNHRARFRRTLRRWASKCQNDDEYVSTRALDDVKSTIFYLPYQGLCDLNIQKEYGTLLSHLMKRKYPQFDNCATYKILRKRRAHLRVGYISNYLCWHTVGKLFFGWIQHHDLEKFDIYAYHLGPDRDFLTQKFEEAATSFVHFPDENIGAIATKIRADKLDILVHFDYGMSVVAAKLAATRLAPIQCLAWGHPETSGLPTVDYFISSEMMEPTNGDKHYSEKLVQLPNIGVCVPQVASSISTKTRADYGLSNGRKLYVSPHSLFKHLPQYDNVFPLIAMKNRRAEFVFIERDTHSIEVATEFKARLCNAFSQYDLDANEYIKFLPSQSFHDYLQLLSISDVYLDSIGWSGGMTSLEALGCMVPIVTMPGQFMRGRHSYACLKRINVTETIAHSVDEYVKVAVRLTLDEAWREKILSKQAANLPKLYDDRDCILSLEMFYERCIALRSRTSVF